MSPVRTCPACGDPFDPEAPPRHRVDEWTVVCCGTCGTGVTVPRPDPEELAGMYDDPEYFSSRGIQHPELPSGHRERAQALKSVAPGPRILEIGCGEGYLLKALQDEGFDVVGCEPSGWAVEVARSRFDLEVFRGVAEAAPFPPGSFDMVLLYHVLEHVEEPLELLRQARGFTRPGGLVVVEVPNLQSGQFRFGPGRGRHILDLPYHLVHFTPEGLRRIIGRSGLRLQELTIPFGPPLRPILAIYEGLRRRHTPGTAPDLSATEPLDEEPPPSRGTAGKTAGGPGRRRWKDRLLRFLLHLSSDHKMTAYAVRPPRSERP